MRIAAALGDPERDPHGEPIPSAELVMPADNSIPLSSMQPEQEAALRRVDAQETEFLRYLEELGLIPAYVSEAAVCVTLRSSDAYPY